MKTGKLYLKFFLTFLAIFIVTEFLIFSFFHYVVGRRVSAHMADVNRYAVSSLIEDRLSRTHALNPEDNPQLRKLLSEIARVYNARVWITENDTLVCSSENTRCAMSADCPQKKEYSVRSYMYISSRHPERFFSAQISLPQGRTGILYMTLKRPPWKPHDTTFAFGLAGIGVLIALMLFPLYRFISKPLGELRSTAMDIASGNLSARAPVRSSDEIGELAKVFNTMADNVERMVKSTRELTANISHELRSPLARIRVAEELLEEKLDDPEKAKRYIESIKEETTEIDRLIGDILHLSRLNMNSASKSAKEFDIAGMIKDLAAIWNDSILHASLNLSMDILDDKVLINGQSEEIQATLNNLIANAIKFTPSNGNIWISLNKDNSDAIIKISNTCRVPEPADLEKIFEPFYRIKGSSSQGSGLGLTIARRIAENSGGDLKAAAWESGIEMILRLPISGKS